MNTGTVDASALGASTITDLAGIRTGLGRFVVHQGSRSERSRAADQGGRISEPTASARRGINWNVMALTDLAGRVVERYHYSPYGELEVSAESYPGDYNGDGRVDSDDDDELCGAGGGCDCEFTASVSGACRVFDFDCDGDLDATDEEILRSVYMGLATDLQNHRIPSTTHSPVGNPFAFQGLVFDAEMDGYHVRHRWMSPELMEFGQRDPFGLLGGRQMFRAPVQLFVGSADLWTTSVGPSPSIQYGDSMNLYAYEKHNPAANLDPTGLATSLMSAEGLAALIEAELAMGGGAIPVTIAGRGTIWVTNTIMTTSPTTGQKILTFVCQGGGQYNMAASATANVTRLSGGFLVQSCKGGGIASTLLFLSMLIIAYCGVRVRWRSGTPSTNAAGVNAQ